MSFALLVQQHLFQLENHQHQTHPLVVKHLVLKSYYWRMFLVSGTLSKALDLVSNSEDFYFFFNQVQVLNSTDWGFLIQTRQNLDYNNVITGKNTAASVSHSACDT